MNILFKFLSGVISIILKLNPEKLLISKGRFWRLKFTEEVPSTFRPKFWGFRSIPPEAFGEGGLEIFSLPSPSSSFNPRNSAG